MFRSSLLRTCQISYRGCIRHVHTVNTRPQTIYALSSSPGKAGVAVVRISGNNAKEVQKVFHNVIFLRILIK